MIDLLNWFLSKHMDAAVFLVISFWVILNIVGIAMAYGNRNGKLLEPPEHED